MLKNATLRTPKRRLTCNKVEQTMKGRSIIGCEGTGNVNTFSKNCPNPFDIDSSKSVRSYNHDKKNSASITVYNE